MELHPEVSVVLPFYNAEGTLSAAIGSILNQTFPAFELLLVNNNSDDGSLIIAQGFAQKDKRIRIVHEKEQGVDWAMNCGLNNARGRFIARMDADDVSFPDRIEKQIRFLKENPDYGLIGSMVEYVSHIRNADGFKRFVSWVNSFYSTEAIEMNRFIEIPIVNPTVLFRRELYEKYGGCRQGDFPEDYEMLLRYLNAGVKMAKLPEPLLEWHDYSTRLTRTGERYSTEAFFRVKAEYFRKWSEDNNPKHPCVWIWGAGRKTRQRARLLEKEGLFIQGYVDIIKNKTSQKTTLHCSEIPPPGNLFIISMVANYGAKEFIKDFLLRRRYREGKDFFIMA